MANQELRVDIGDPEFRSRVYQRYRTAIESMMGLVALASKISTTQPVSETLHKVIGRIACIVTNSLGAVVILVLNGYGNDAMKIVRSMFEGAVNAGYLKRHPEQLQDYLDYTWIRQKKRLDYMKKYAPDPLQYISLEKIAETERKFKSVVNRFTNRRGKLRGSWTKVPLGQRAEEVGMGQLYLTFYDWVSSMQHLDIGGLSLQAEAGTLAVDVAPSYNWIKEALVVGHGSAVQVLSHYNEIAQLGMDKEMEAISEGFKLAWKK